MKTKVIYQITITGALANFSEGKTYYSRNLYGHKPTEKEIDVFINKCCFSENGNIGVMDLDRDSIDIKINELILKD